MSTPDADPQSLRDEIAQLIADAAQVEIDHHAALRLVAEEHAEQVAELVETARLLALENENQRAADRREIDNVRRALITRDLIGQAKGILAVTVGCSPEQGFAMMVNRSQRENRKLVEIAGEVVERIVRRVDEDGSIARSA